MDEIRGNAIHHPNGLLLDVQYLDEGAAYATHTERERDNAKIWHYLIEGDKATEIDWTPYQIISPHELHLWRALGRPRRFGVGPLDYGVLLRLVRLARKNDQIVEVPKE